MKTCMALIGGLVWGLVLTGCVESATEVRVNRDGSGTVLVREMYSPQISGMLQMALQQEGADPSKDIFEEMIEAKLAQLGPGAEQVRSAPAENAQGWKGYEAEYRFPDVRLLRLTLGDGPGTSARADADDDAAIRFDFESGPTARLTVRQPPVQEPDGEETEVDEAMSEAMMPMIAPMLAGMRITFSVSVEDGIRETNGQYMSEDRTSFVLLDLPMDRVLANKEALRILTRNAPDAAARLAELGLEGVRIEPPGKAVRVTF